MHILHLFFPTIYSLEVKSFFKTWSRSLNLLSSLSDKIDNESFLYLAAFSLRELTSGLTLSDK